MTTSIKKKILADFIDNAVRKEFFVGDKGVVVVNRFLRYGRPSWLIKSTIDDHYKDNPPLEWASLDRDIVLFYDTQSSMHDVTEHKPTPELLRCLDEAIGDRLYIRPPQLQRLLDSGFKTPSGKPIIVNVHRLPISSSIVIVFEADGSVV
ncbi:hypothetical protein [Spirosoma flavum]|uniref:Uncharacterized protein n=1 Tax=Spirosoma flavum TaxID=2048557 RepID=A0ABW6ALI9_9BACT